MHGPMNVKRPDKSKKITKHHNTKLSPVSSSFFPVPQQFTGDFFP